MNDAHKKLQALDVEPAKNLVAAINDPHAYMALEYAS